MSTQGSVWTNKKG